MRRIIINTLNKLGHQDVAEAGNGREGLDRLSAGPVDLIITDWNMPEMSGIDFIRTVRSMPEIKDTPVLMVTTNAAKDDIVEALKPPGSSCSTARWTPRRSLPRRCSGSIRRAFTESYCPTRSASSRT
jgi:two-component system chemotaxis response regulator CheY